MHKDLNKLRKRIHEEEANKRVIQMKLTNIEYEINRLIKIFGGYDVYWKPITTEVSKLKKLINK